MIEIVYSGIWYMGKKERFGECKKKTIAEFKERLSTEVRRQEKLNIAEEWDFKKREVTGEINSKNAIWMG